MKAKTCETCLWYIDGRCEGLSPYKKKELDDSCDLHIERVTRLGYNVDKKEDIMRGKQGGVKGRFTLREISVLWDAIYGRKVEHYRATGTDKNRGKELEKLLDKLTELKRKAEQAGE